jgi:hypothetical protein
MKMLQTPPTLKPAPPGRETVPDWTEQLDDLFDDFVRADRFQQPTEPSNLDSPTNFFDFPTTSSCSSPSKIPTSSRRDDVAIQSPGAAQQRLASSCAGNEAAASSKSRGRAALSVSDFSLDGLIHKSDASARNPSVQISPTLASRPVRTKSAANLSRVLSRPGPISVEKLKRKREKTPRMMRPSFYSTGYQEAFAKKLNISISTTNVTPASPPPPSELAQFENGSGFNCSTDETSCFPESLGHEDEVVSPISTDMSGPYHISPLSSPGPDGNGSQDIDYQPRPNAISSSETYFTGPYQAAPIGFVQTPPPSHGLPASSWTPDATHGPDLSFSGWSSPTTGSPGTNSSLAWTRTKNASTQPCSGPTFSGMPPLSPNDEDAQNCVDLLTMGRQSNGLQNIAGQLVPDLATSGLLIQCTNRKTASTTPASLHHSSMNSASGSNSYSNPSPALYSASFPSGSNSHSGPTSSSAESSSPSYAALGASPTYAPQPRMVAPLHADGNARPVASPPPLQSSQTRAPATNSRSSHGRRKSSGGSTGGGTHARRGSNGVAVKTGRASSTASAPAVGFVNFTALDSRKLLGGVAPSGSSKTKARREKEAMENRRKLSQAAARAVMAAGGDLSSLEREGLLGEY